jgi:glycosyltransferase involved in cell wall biosynthesis
VKEANALVEAGYQTHIIATSHAPVVNKLDESIYSDAQWSYSTIKINLNRRIIGSIIRRIANALVSIGSNQSDLLVCNAYNSATTPLRKKALARSADLYIAHNLAALPAAAAASYMRQARLGFDAEDFHLGELIDTEHNRTSRCCIKYIERKYFPKCNYLTSASPFISEEYRKIYGVEMTPILNVFPLAEADHLDGYNFAKGLNRGVKSIYWFSQTISTDRGLDTALRALAAMKTHAMLYIRGTPTKEFESYLWPLTKTLSIADKVKILEPKPPQDMIKFASMHDVGLSLENTQTRNKDICLGNKIFTYLLAGIPQILTKTSAQSKFAILLGNAAKLIDVDNVEQCAKALDEYLGCESQLKLAKACAFDLARSRYNWDYEKQIFLNVVGRCMSSCT